MNKVFTIISLLILSYSCTRIPVDNVPAWLDGNGVFILNEGNFTWGNGSLSFYSYDSTTIYNNLFQAINGRPLGDVPNSIGIFNDKIFIVVNNSGKIEVAEGHDLHSLATINGLVSPRNICSVDINTAYVTSIYSDSVAIIDLSALSVTGYINLRRSSEAIVVTGSKAFIANWVGGKELMVVNTLTNEVVDSVEVGAEPESMVLDKNNLLWVLCNGGWARENFAELIAINTLNNKIVKRIVFPDKLDSPSCLQIDGKGETLYYLEGGVNKMNINDTELPADPFIGESGHYFYKMAVDPQYNDIFLTDAVDFQQQGFLVHFNEDGAFIDEQKAEVIPGAMTFKIN